MTDTATLGSWVLMASVVTTLLVILRAVVIEVWSFLRTLREPAVVRIQDEDRFYKFNIASDTLADVEHTRQALDEIETQLASKPRSAIRIL